MCFEIPCRDPKIIDDVERILPVLARRGGAGCRIVKVYVDAVQITFELPSSERKRREERVNEVNVGRPL